MKLKCRAYVSYQDQSNPESITKGWIEIPLPSEPFSSIDNCWQWMRRMWPNAQIRLEWIYNGK